MEEKKKTKKKKKYKDKEKKRRSSSSDRESTKKHRSYNKHSISSDLSSSEKVDKYVSVERTRKSR